MTKSRLQFITRLTAPFVVIAYLFLPLDCYGGETPQNSNVGALVDLEKRIAEHPALPDLVAYAYRASPTIQAARASWRAKVERYRVETSFEDPQVMLEGMYMVDTSGNRTTSPDDWKATLTQPLPLPGQLAKAGVVAESEAGIAHLGLDSAVRDTTLRIRESFQELLYLQEARRLAAANQDLLQQLRKVAETASSATNRVALVDIMKAQAQVGQVGYDLLLLQESERTEQARLNSILNRVPDAPIGALAEEPLRAVVYTLQEIYPLAEKNLEEIRIAQASVDKADAMVDLTRYQTLPKFALGVSYGDINMRQQVGVQAGLSLPLWLGKNAGRMGEARAEAEKMRAQRSVQVNETRVGIRDVYFRLQNSERLVRLYRDDLVPQANRAMQKADTWFKEGQGSFSDYSETAAAWYNFQLALARAKADYGKFLARLESLAGQTLTNRGTKDKTALPAGEGK